MGGRTPPRSANELGCQANGGVPTGCAPPRSANAPGQRPPMDRYPPGQIPPWTETPMDRYPLDREYPGQRPPGQRTPWTETPLGRDPCCGQTNITFAKFGTEGIARKVDVDVYLSQHPAGS